MSVSVDFPGNASNLTTGYFRDNLHNCAESVFRALLSASGRECPVEMTRIASAFGRGMGMAGCACGALVGGEMALGVFFGREKETGSAPDICADAAKLLHKRFKKENGATCCRILHKGLPFGTDEQFDSCCDRATKAAEIAAKVIQEMFAKEDEYKNAQEEES